MYPHVWYEEIVHKDRYIYSLHYFLPGYENDGCGRQWQIHLNWYLLPAWCRKYWQSFSGFVLGRWGSTHSPMFSKWSWSNLESGFLDFSPQRQTIKIMNNLRVRPHLSLYVQSRRSVWHLESLCISPSILSRSISSICSSFDILLRLFIDQCIVKIYIFQV